MVGWPPSVPQWEWDFVQGTDPTTETTVKEGNTWYDSTNNEGYVYDGAAWSKVTVGEYLELGGTLPQSDVPNDTIITRMIAADAVTNTQVAENAVDTPQIVADAVTGAEVVTEDIQDIAGGIVSDGLNYDDAANTIAAALGTALNIDANGNIQVPNGAIATALIAADAVTNTELANDSVDTAQVVNSAITTALLAADAVTNTEIANDAVDSPQIVTGAVDEGHLGFATATQTELDNHAGDATNPHNVTDSQTGAATALSNHEAVAGAHHAKTAPGPVVDKSVCDVTNVKINDTTGWSATLSSNESAIIYSTTFDPADHLYYEVESAGMDGGANGDWYYVTAELRVDGVAVYTKADSTYINDPLTVNLNYSDLDKSQSHTVEWWIESVLGSTETWTLGSVEIRTEYQTGEV